MTTQSGWCSPAWGLTHTKGQHLACKSPVCQCPEFGGHEKPVADRDSRTTAVAFGGEVRNNIRTNQDGPGGSQRELQAVVPGPRPTRTRSAEL